jgi:osmoprotectant transport system substrate-binding protein
MTHKSLPPLALTAVIALALSACGSDSAGGGDGPLAGESYVVGAKDFSEQDILAHMTALLLQQNGAAADVERITGSVNTRSALESGELDMYWEYTGTGWITYLGNTEPIGDPVEQFEAVKTADAEQNGIAWLVPADFNNTYALAVRSEYAEEHGLQTLSDLAEFSRANSEEVTICVESEFAARDDGLSGLLAAYGMTVPESQINIVDTGVIYTETDSGETCNFGEVFATDGRIANLDLTVLEDDLAFFPVYQGAITMEEATLEANPELAEILAPLAEQLDTETMQQLNAQVDVDGLDAEDVAAAWLEEQELL